MVEQGRKSLPSDGTELTCQQMDPFPVEVEKEFALFETPAAAAGVAQGTACIQTEHRRAFMGHFNLLTFNFAG